MALDDIARGQTSSRDKHYPTTDIVPEQVAIFKLCPKEEQLLIHIVSAYTVDGQISCTLFREDGCGPAWKPWTN